MVRGVPAWGLYRLLKALEIKGVDGEIDMNVSGGTVTLGLASGKVHFLSTDIAELGLGAFLLRARLASPEGLQRTETIARTQGIGLMQALVAAGQVHPDTAVKLATAHIRSVLAVLFANPVSNWTLRPGPHVPGAQTIELCPELMRAVARYQDMKGIRDVVSRNLLSGPLSLAPGSETQLADASVLIGDAPVLYMLRQGRLHELTPKVLDQEDNLRVLFALAVAGVLGGSEDGVSEGGRQNASGFSEVMKELRTAAAGFKTHNHYEVIGVPVDARLSAILAAYGRTKRRFSGARYSGVVGPEATPMLTIINRRIDDARTTLIDRTTRLHYNRSIGLSTPQVEARLAVIFDALAYWSLGKDLFRERKFTQAAELFEQARGRDPQEPLFTIWTVRAKIGQTANQQTLEWARQIIEQAQMVEPEMVDAHLALAHVARLQNQAERAEESLRAALRLDPENEEARTLRRLLQVLPKENRISFEKKRGSLLDRVRKLWNSED